MLNLFVDAEAKEIMFSPAFVCLFVCPLAGLCKATQPIFTKFNGKVACGPRKKPLDSGGNPDHLTLGFWLQVTFMSPRIVGYVFFVAHV